uniref:peptide-methionine (S)-S-oxide reductase n=3 Tax=Corethron hystrix TaxID=216773 RepID=A0A7S1BPQ2_9STRA|mmetsp:Transcript_33785/g.78008  ORF Transcript_33785/g.78008 Transcript_33785/m.78008 type:complete len:180 (+) Transcript_33785:248-787(+)
MSSTALSAMSPYVYLGAGCYWGTEKYVKKDFQKLFPGSIKSAKVGFMNPDSNSKIVNPTYREVCTGRTGHVEVLYVELADPMILEELVKFFFMFHDPTTLNRQGNDVGTQYASYIFTSDNEQMRICERVKKELQKHLDEDKIKSYSSDTITTQISSATKFTEAEEAHQEYLMKNPNGYW